MPVVRVGDTLLFPGGASRVIGPWARLMYRLGLRKTVRPRTPWEQGRDPQLWGTS
jgi:hypothetical protein